MTPILLKKEKKRNYVGLFMKFIKKAKGLPLKKRKIFVEKKFQYVKNKLKFPIINKNEVVFVYKGQCKDVKLVGDMTVWKIFPITLNRLKGTDFFYLKRYYELNARLDYKFLIDGASMILDPLNPKIIHGGFGANSELIMPNYQKHSESNYSKKINHGKIIAESIKCEAFKEGNKIIVERNISIYLPPNYRKNKKYRVLYFKDGSDYIKFGKAPNILDNMISRKQIEPVIAVFIDPIDRDEDYVLSNKDIYVNFFLNKLIPWIEKKYSARKDKEGRALIGASAGGNIIAYIVYKNPDKFDCLLYHSGYFSFGYDEEYGRNYFKEITNISRPLKIFMVIGNYDLDLISPNIWFYSDLMDNLPIKKLELRKYPQGHTWGLWRDTLREGLIWLLKEKTK